MFAFTDWTAAWSVQSSPFLERETTLFTRGRFHSKASRMYRLCNMLEMIKGFSLFNPEQFRNLSQIKTFPFQDFSNLLPQSQHLFYFKVDAYVFRSEKILLTLEIGVGFTSIS